MRSVSLVKATAKSVLGDYEHSVEILDPHGFAIIYGPNGVGKTKFLEIIHATVQFDTAMLQKLPFQEASLLYSDETVLTVVRTPSVGSTGSGDHTPATKASRYSLLFTIESPREGSTSWDAEGPSLEQWLLEDTTWRPFSDDLWEDVRDGELADLNDLRQRYSGPDSVKQEVPERFQDLRTQVGSFLIETQRLRTASHSRQTIRVARGMSRVSHASQSRIVQQADRMRELINDAQTEHSRITQQLDRTFPNRVLEKVELSESSAEPASPDADEIIRARYNEQNNVRSRLGRISSVSLEDELSLPDGTLEPWARQMLSLYLTDADEKLQPLEQIINSRLLHKSLQITANQGFQVRRDPAEKERVRQDDLIPLDALSSGEQHEVILMFDLLFKVPAGSVVLIDEPEISLHVAWQLAFIPDVQQIAELVGFKFIVATHSPQIINDSWHLAKRLGPEEAVFE
jgi:predicted ATP-binding protein involved in virulence